MNTLDSLLGLGVGEQGRLKGHKLVVARAAWAIVTLGTWLLFLMALPDRFAQLMIRALEYRVELQQVGLFPAFLAVYALMPELELLVAFSLAGFVIFWRRSDDWVAIFMSLTLITLPVIFTPTLDVLLATPYTWRFVLILQSLAFVLSIIFLYLFPDGEFVPRWTRYMAWGWVAWGVILPWLPAELFVQDFLDTVLLFMLFIFGYGSGIAAQIYRYTSVSNAEQRKQTKWVFGGSIIAILAAFFSTAVNAGVRPFLSSGILGLLHMLVLEPVLSYFPALLLLLALGFSVWRYRLWDVDLILNRSLVYGVLTAALGGMYVLLVFLLTLLVRSLLSWANDTLVVFTATISIALAFKPLRQRVQVFIDRAFYPSKVNYERLIPDLSARVATSIVLERLATLLTEEIPRQLQIRWGSLAMLDAEDACLSTVSEYGKSCLLSSDHPLVTYLCENEQPLSVAHPPPDLPARARVFLEQQGAVIAIPLLVGEKLVGIYTLGPKMSGVAYSSEEIRLLTLLGKQAAVSVENARLYRQVETYSRTLEQQVQTRTQALEEANRNLEAQNAKLDIILRNMADALVVTDLEGQIVLANPVFESAVGRSVEALQGQRLAEAWPDEILLQTTQGALAAPGTVVSADSHRDGRIYRAAACTLGGPEDSTDGVVTVLRDITAQVQATEMKDKFVSTVSHELRTPMTSILGFSKLIRKQFAREVSPRISEEDGQGQRAVNRIQENLDIIVSEGERLTRLVNDVLDVAKMESGRMQWEMGEVNLSEIIERSVTPMRSLAGEKDLALNAELEDELPPLHGDRDRLIQVVTNLLSNAVKFTDEGEVRVSARLLPPGEGFSPLGVRQPGVSTGLPAPYPTVVVRVTDTGIGIAENDLATVFEKFQQVGNRSEGTRRSGTGLGLSICKEIVEYHGGHMWVESDPGVGSCFVFTLPVTSEQEIATPR